MSNGVRISSGKRLATGRVEDGRDSTGEESGKPSVLKCKAFWVSIVSRMATRPTESFLMGERSNTFHFELLRNTVNKKTINFNNFNFELT